MIEVNEEVGGGKMNREEEKFRKAVEELRDSYELHLRRWAERCLQDIEIAYEKEREKNKELVRAVNKLRKDKSND